MAKKKKVELPRPELNLTAMMDLVLNLILFFVLISNFAAAQNPAMEVPKPDGSLARPSPIPNKVVVNILAEENSGAIKEVTLGPEHFAPGDYARLTQLLVEEAKKSAEVSVDLRADRSLHYSDVAPVMSAISATNVIKTINVAAAVP
jgi:biopolymer transport protein ExbD